MDEFFKGFNALKHTCKSIDMSEEMKDLLKIYRNDKEEAEAEQEEVLMYLVRNMKQFVEAYDQSQTAKGKLQSLEEKLSKPEEDGDE